MNFISDMFGMIGDYDERNVGSTKVDGLRVSTVYSSDYGYETAICDSKKIYPVERYPDLNTAISGHNRWVDKAVGLNEVVCLRYLDLTGDESVNLVREEKVL